MRRAAFPEHPFCVVDGMSLREYLAAKAMQGLLAGTNVTGPWPEPLWLAEKSYQYADAMIKEGGKS